MICRDYDDNDDIEVTDEMVAAFDATCASIEAKRKAVAERYAKRVAHEGRNKVPPIALTRPSGMSAMWKATVAGLAAGLGDVTNNPPYGFDAAAKIIGAGRSPKPLNDRLHDTYTRGEVVRRWAVACERGERTIATNIYEQARRGDTLLRGHIPDGEDCRAGKCSTCATLNEYPVEARPTIAAILAYGSDRDLYIRKSRKKPPNP